MVGRDGSWTLSASLTATLYRIRRSRASRRGVPRHPAEGAGAGLGEGGGGNNPCPPDIYLVGGRDHENPLHEQVRLRARKEVTRRHRRRVSGVQEIRVFLRVLLRPVERHR
jgi:hypothetical protein